MPAAIDAVALRSAARRCSVLIVAAGFEARARRILEVLKQDLPPRILLVEYSNEEPANLPNLAHMTDLLSAAGARSACNIVTFEPTRPDDFIASLKTALLGFRPDADGEVWLDVSALPMQGVCAALAACREALPALPLRVLYTEPAKYFPTLAQTKNHPNAVSALSSEMSRNLIAKHFAGSAADTATCLILFAGYEIHRSLGAVDELNPAKVVLVFGRPARPELAWREAWSRRLHSPIPLMRPTATESVGTLAVGESVVLLEEYYDFLFEDHNIVIAPLCSKMQCVASYLTWERHRDIQLLFPLPVRFLPDQSSRGFREMYEYQLPPLRLL